jgi:hypothetical protein
MWGSLYNQELGRRCPPNPNKIRNQGGKPYTNQELGRRPKKTGIRKETKKKQESGRRLPLKIRNQHDQGYH